MNFEALKAPFPPDKVHWRIGSTTKDNKKGMALAYIDARDVMERLDAVCTPGGWQCRYTHAQGTVVCEIGICTLYNDDTGEMHWIWKADGAGATQYEAEKGSLSDAFKRAAVRWGIGRYLYDLPAPWVEIDERKRIKQHEYAGLRRLLGDTTPHSEPPQEPEGPPVEPPQEPGPWWEGESLHLPVPKDAHGELQWGTWVESPKGFVARVGRAPSPDHLDKLCKDNLDTITYVKDNCAPGLYRKIDEAIKARHKYFAQAPRAAAE